VGGAKAGTSGRIPSGGSVLTTATVATLTLISTAIQMDETPRVDIQIYYPSSASKGRPFI